MTRFVFPALLALVAATAADAQMYRGQVRAGQVRVGPFGGIAAGQSRATFQATPFGTTASRVRGFTQATPNGTTIQSGTRVGSFGAAGGSARGVRVTSPTGASRTTTCRRGGFVLR